MDAEQPVYADPYTRITWLVARLSACEAERDKARTERDELTIVMSEMAAEYQGRLRAEARVEAAERERDHYRDLVEKVGVANALRGLLAAAEPLCGKLEVIPGRLKLPPEYYPAASPLIGTLREAVAAARAVLAPSQQEVK